MIGRRVRIALFLSSGTVNEQTVLVPASLASSPERDFWDAPARETAVMRCRLYLDADPVDAGGHCARPPAADALLRELEALLTQSHEPVQQDPQVTYYDWTNRRRGLNAD